MKKVHKIIFVLIFHAHFQCKAIERARKKIKFFILQINDCLEHASEFESEKTERMRRQNERRDLSGCVLIIVAEMK